MDEKCDECGNEKGKKLYCARCKKAKYCNSDCQKRHWVTHKINCKTLIEQKMIESKQPNNSQTSKMK